jgi:hypothetical protein
MTMSPRTVNSVPDPELPSHNVIPVRSVKLTTVPISSTMPVNMNSGGSSVLCRRGICCWWYRHPFRLLLLWLLVPPPLCTSQREAAEPESAGAEAEAVVVDDRRGGSAAFGATKAVTPSTNTILPSPPFLRTLPLVPRIIIVQARSSSSGAPGRYPKRVWVATLIMTNSTTSTTNYRLSSRHVESATSVERLDY